MKKTISGFHVKQKISSKKAGTKQEKKLIEWFLLLKQAFVLGSRIKYSKKYGIRLLLEENKKFSMT